MCGDSQEAAPQALRELAHWVVRDGIDSDHLDGYMHTLLSDRLVELHAECRLQAIAVVRSCGGLGPRDVASRLCEVAREIERVGPTHGESSEFGFRPRILPAHAMAQADCVAAERRPGDVRHPAEHASYMPEFIVSILFMAIGMGFLMSWPGALFPRSAAGSSDRILQLAVAVAYSLLGLLSGYEGARRLRWHFHSRES